MKNWLVGLENSGFPEAYEFLKEDSPLPVDESDEGSEEESRHEPDPDYNPG